MPPDPVDPLAEYRDKRDPDKTPEPFGGTPAIGARQFVIQKHAATRLHYDLRLEHDGVLLSWAVPQGISLDPSVKRFAAHTEDHPLDYAEFEGVIPDGEYGAGPMIVWDRGSLEIIEDPKHGVEHGKLLFDLHGYKINGRFTLVKTTKGLKDWLLIKKPDAWSRDGEPDFDESSVLSGRTIDDLVQGSTRVDTLRDLLTSWNVPLLKPDSRPFTPMLAETADEPFSRPDWLFEIKYDGYRLIARKSDHLVLLHYRSGVDATDIFPEIASAVAALPAQSFVLDGEVVVLDSEGKPSFGALQKRGKLTNHFDVRSASVRSPATLFVFDFIGFEGRDLTQLPLVRRKEALAYLVPRVGPLRFADHVPERGIETFEGAAAMGLEGIMAKRSNSPYRFGRSDDWLKMRVEHTDTFAVVGFTKPEGTRAHFGALHVAGIAHGALVYAGRVGTGFDTNQIRDIHTDLIAISGQAAPVIDLPDDETSTWVAPELFIDVRYKEVTADGVLRQPVFVRTRLDASLDTVADLTTAHEERGEPPALVDAPTFRTSNLDKVFWPDDGYTKGDLLAYYDAVADHLLPYLADRPLVTVRYPDGIAGKSFYQKNAPDFVPPTIRTEWVTSSDDGIPSDSSGVGLRPTPQHGNNYFVCEDAEALRYIINLGAIPLHIWASRIATIETPDWCILDLDPKTAPFTAVVTVARAIKRLCDDMDVPCHVKTSGQSGLHVMVPMGTGHDYTQQRLLGELMARIVESGIPDIATTVRSPAARGDRVYIDFIQNGRGKLIAAPYAVRPVPGATVSAPLRWSEVTQKLDPARFTIKTMPSRLSRMKNDPLLPILDGNPNLTAGLARLTER
ncbi:MAG: DNA ligase D [Acidimicrobiia bacterium]|nr:DNA ligase D [Acidimicrobiia bacterium]